MTQIDYDREMAFIAVRPDAEYGEVTLGVVRAIADPDNEAAEFAIIVRSDLKQRGLGAILMRKIIAYCRSRGTQRLIGQVLPNNAGMLKLARECGFEVGPVNPDGIELTLQLRAK